MLFRSNDTATTEIYTVPYTLSLHDALPISSRRRHTRLFRVTGVQTCTLPISVALEISQASGATVFDMQLEAHLTGACMRCLGFAEVVARVRTREFHDFDAPAADELHSDYVANDHLELGAWARDAVALELPEQILCREDCAGLCPVCGTNLNRDTCSCDRQMEDPRLAALKSLRPIKRES